MRESSTNMFPEHVSIKRGKRTLALYEKGMLYCENGSSYAVRSFDELLHYEITYGLLVYVADFSLTENFPYLAQCVIDTRCSVLCNKKGVVLSIRSKAGNETRWVASLKEWGLPFEIESLLVLRQFFDYMRVGEYPTIGGVGNALLSDVWNIRKLYQHSVINGYADKFCRNNMVGGRVDTPGLGNFYHVAMEDDIDSGYLANSLYLPCGTACRFKRGYISSYETYVAECRVRVHHELPLGPFPMRVHERGRKGVAYPVQPGWYDVTLWKEQIEDCARLGCDVEVGEGYGFTEMTEDGRYFSELLFLHKLLAHPAIAPLVKRTGVSAIGRQAMSNTYYLLEYDSGNESDVPLHIDGKPSRLVITKHTNFNGSKMIHWYWYILARTARQVFWHALPYAQENRLICTNYDSVMYEPNQRDYDKYAEKHVSALGSWKTALLHNVTVLAARTVTCDEYTKTPGIPVDERNEVYGI